MINYLSRFEPKIADLTHRLRSLLKDKSNEFIWTDGRHSDDFKTPLIDIMCNSLVKATKVLQT